MIFKTYVRKFTLIFHIKRIKLFTSTSSLVSADDKKVAKESKIAKFLRRTQSAHDDKQCAGGGPVSLFQISVLAGNEYVFMYVTAMMYVCISHVY